MLKPLLIILFLSAFIGFALFSLIKAQELVYSLSHPPVRKSPLAEGIIPFSYKKFDFMVKEGLTLKAIDYMPKMRPRATIIVCHYLGGSKESVFPYVEFLLKSGFRILSFDYRNHGESDSEYRTKFHLDEDICRFFDRIKSMGIQGPFGILGFSMGATPALTAFERYPEVKAAVVDSGPLLLVKDYFIYVLDNKSIKNPLTRFYFIQIFLYYAGFLKMSRKMVEYLKNLKGKPVFFIHGEKDSVIPIKNALEAFTIVESERACFWSVPNSRHLTNYFLKRFEYEKKVVGFFEKWLADSAIEDDGVKI